MAEKKDKAEKKRIKRARQKKAAETREADIQEFLKNKAFIESENALLKKEIKRLRKRFDEQIEEGLIIRNMLHAQSDMLADESCRAESLSSRVMTIVSERDSLNDKLDESTNKLSTANERVVELEADVEHLEKSALSMSELQDQISDMAARMSRSERELDNMRENPIPPEWLLKMVNRARMNPGDMELFANMSKRVIKWVVRYASEHHPITFDSANG